MSKFMHFPLFAFLMNLATADDQCSVRVTIPGTALKGFVFKRIPVTAPYMCDVRCEQEIACQSYNYVIKEKICELNNRTKEARPENFHSDPARFYARRLNSGVYRNRADIYRSGERRDGVYTIEPDNLSAFDVFCDQSTAGGGWTVFQKRLDGSVYFYRNWNAYKHGFGNLNGEFWLGLDKIHRLTLDNNSMLRVDLEDFEGNSAYAEYNLFGVTSENDKYKLAIGNYTGTASDALSWHRGQSFSTYDQDNDNRPHNCAIVYRGAWWYHECHHSNLNGLYRRGPHSSYADGVNWRHWKGHYYSLKRTEMKIRPVNF